MQDPFVPFALPTTTWKCYAKSLGKSLDGLQYLKYTLLSVAHRETIFYIIFPVEYNEWTLFYMYRHGALPIKFCNMISKQILLSLTIADMISLFPPTVMLLLLMVVFDSREYTFTFSRRGEKQNTSQDRDENTNEKKEKCKHLSSILRSYERSPWADPDV